jgi:hypothetical protein
MHYDAATASRRRSNIAQPPLKVLYEIAELLYVDIKDLLASSRDGKMKTDF